MNKLLSSLDKWVISIITNIVGVFMISLTIIVFLQVLFRYLLKVSIGTIGELPVYLMIFSVWLMSAALARQDGHIKIEIISLIIKNKKILKFIKLVVDILTLAAIALFTYLSFEYVKFGIETGDKAVGLKVPLWWLTSILLISTTLMTVYYIMYLYKGVEEMRKWK